MRKIILVAAAFGAALTVSACGETAESTDDTAEAIEADADANLEALEVAGEDAMAEGDAMMEDGAAAVDDAMAEGEKAMDEAAQ